jgi:hypothetical protein
MKSMDKEVLYKEIIKFFDSSAFADRTQTYWRQYVTLGMRRPQTPAHIHTGLFTSVTLHRLWFKTNVKETTATSLRRTAGVKPPYSR